MKWSSVPCFALVNLGLLFASHSGPGAEPEAASTVVAPASKATTNLTGRFTSIDGLRQIDPNHPGLVKPSVTSTNPARWYQDSVFYHIWLDGFADSDADGYGDLTGVLNHLDYLNDGRTNSPSSLGVTALWLSPFFDANSRHRYDAKSYYKVDPRLGDLNLLKTLVQRAHQQGMRVIFDMVPNHTSSRHPFFVNSRSRTNAALRDFYVWSNALPPGWHLPWGRGDESARVWTRTDYGYYYHAFSPSMPDLNYLNPLVIQEMENVMRFYLNLGFDGIRLDAVRYLVEEGNTKTADAPTTHRVLKEFRTAVNEYPDDRYVVGEVWTDNDIVRSYYGNGNDELAECFNFQFSGSVAKTLEQADAEPIDANISYLCRNLPHGSTPANFLVNHDNAGSRTMTRYNKDLRKVRLAVALNLLEFGTPYVYYGEEIGMEGQNGNDQNMRRPFRWPDAEAQAKDPQSLEAWHRNLIHARLGNAALRHGDYRRVDTGDKQVYAFLRSASGQKALCLFNLNTTAAKELTLNLAGELTRNAYAIIGHNGEGPPAAYRISLKPGEVMVLSLDLPAEPICETPQN